jgi:two-component system, LytTR family, sensor kinase
MILNALRGKKYKGFIMHFILWSGLLFLNYFLFGMPGINFDYRFNLITWSVYILLFYLNYAFFVPEFLFKKKYFLYILLLIVALTCSLIIKKEIDSHFFKQRIERVGFPERDRKPPVFMREFRPGDLQKKPPRIFWFLEIDPFFMPALSQLSLIILASFSLRFIKKWQDDEKIRDEIEKEKISTELSFLKQQINPHFLFNAINSIYSLSVSQKPETSDAIIKLSSILRYMLYETDKQYVSLNNEIQAIDNYIELQKLRLTNKVKLDYNLIGKPGGNKIVPLIMLPLVENAFKHGVDNANDSFINIQIEISDGKLSLTIKNRIVVKNQILESSGIGIKNIIRRLDLLYPDAYKFESNNKEGVFEIKLVLKLEQ